MAQRRRLAASASDAADDAVGAGSGASSRRRASPADSDVRLHAPPAPTPASGTTSHLDPAPQHPLYPSTSPSRPSFTSSQAARLQQRKWASAKTSDAAEGSTLYDERTPPRGKIDVDRKLTTMDRLEGWFGLGTDVSGNAAIVQRQLQLPSPRRPSASTSSTTKNKSTQLVLVHAVAPNDTLEGLAIRYSTDVRTLRRVNGLWPGDSVQVRKELYVPVKEDAIRAQTQAHIGNVENGQLGLLLNGSDSARQGRLLSVTSATSSEATSSVSRAAQLGVLDSDGRPSLGQSPELRRVALHTLSYFPPPGMAIPAAEKGKERQDCALDEIPNSGESGVEDLLQLAERARLRGSDESPPASPLRHLKSLAMAPANGLAAEQSEALDSSRDDRTAFSSPAASSRALNDEEWRPNKYTLGQRKRLNNPSVLSQQSNTTEAGTASTALRGPAMMVAGASEHRADNYQGWNDIPEPPLHRTAQGKVAHAYKPKRRYPRPGIRSDGGVDLPGSALIEDLAAGLPPNPGPAANWARPIGDCLPVPVKNHREHGDRRSSSSTSQFPSSSNWGQILSDTVRGKIRLEDALERGLEDLRAGFSGSTTTTLHPDAATTAGRRANGALRSAMSAQRLSDTYASQRPSAEMARAALAGGIASSSLDVGSAGDAAKAVDAATSSSTNMLGGGEEGPTLRRSSGRSLHELEDLRVQQPDELHVGSSSTWSAPYRSRSPRTDEDGGTTEAAKGGVRGRRYVRDVDWLG